MKKPVIIIIFLLYCSISSFGQPDLDEGFFHALQENDFRAGDSLLKLGADVNLKDEEGTTLLMWFALNNEVHLCNYLLDHGADPELKNAEGKSALDLARENSLLRIAALFEYPDSYTDEPTFEQLTMQSDQFYDQGQYGNALSIAELAASQAVKEYGYWHPKNATAIYNLAYYHQAMGNYDTALVLMEEVLKIDKSFYGENHSEYAIDLSNLAGLYESLGRYEQAISLYQQAIEIKKETLGTNDPSYATSISDLAYLYVNMGRYGQALPLFEETKSIYLEALGSQHPYYISTLTNLGRISIYLGNYSEARIYCEQAVQICKDVLGTNHPLYSTALGNLALYYESQGNYTEALALYSQARDVDKITLGEDHPDYAIDLIDLARIHRLLGDYPGAIRLSENALNIRKEVLGESNPDYAANLNSLAISYELMGNDDYAAALYEQAVKIYEDNSETGHRNYMETLNNLAGLYLRTGDHSRALSAYRSVDSLLNRFLKENFSYMLTSEKEDYAVTMTYYFEVFNSFIVKQPGTKSAFLEMIYDNELNHKGMILNSGSSVRQSIYSSGDAILTERFEQLQSIRQEVTFWEQRPEEAQKMDLASMKSRADSLERELVTESGDFARMNDQFLATWRDVRDGLDSTEAAIEFTSFDYYDGRGWTDSTFYCALVIRHRDTIPRLVYLCEERQLQAALPLPGSGPTGVDLAYVGNRGVGALQMNDNVYHSSVSLYDLILKPLDSLLQGIGTVYFAPSGLLHSVSMAAIPFPDSTLLMDRFDLVQLSSTRTLAMPQEEVKIKNAVVYGGIQYDIDTTAMVAGAGKYSGSEEDLPAYAEPKPRGGQRTGFQYLEGTKEEAEIISGEFQKDDIPVTVYSGSEALEESFSSLSGADSPSVIHIATHGFYLPDTLSSSEDRDLLMRCAVGEQRFRLSDDPLLRSGLVMAGGNMAWRGEPVPEKLEDGILTAREVSNLNLLNTQLVVLSACQTGLGDVKGSEGVEGLLRGFKMAGVRYLILSLWEVPDKETVEFMEHFYDNWLGGMEIRAAFQETQRQMRAKYPDEPYKWAAFVMVE